MPYTTTHVGTMFNVSRETIRSWSQEFAEYLSVSATPGKGGHRQFNDDDLQVFATVSEGKRQGRLFEDIHIDLRSGQRAPIPEQATEVLAATEHRERLTLLMSKINELETERLRLHSENQHQRGMIDVLGKQLTEAQNEIRKLNREIGRLEARDE